MSVDIKKETDSAKTYWLVREIASTFEWLIIAFILAFVFRAFVLEPFRIPTGSMADTLRGTHFRVRCEQCGYGYNYGFDRGKYGYPDDVDIIPRGNIKPYYSRCPSCGYYQLTGGTRPVSNGDRILVLKCIYQLSEPKRWDVVVFKNPLEPSVNYIKRLVAKPGDTVEIINGDIYIDGLISRKPPKVQSGLWMPIYNNDYLPVYPELEGFNGHEWQQPFKNSEGSKWKENRENLTEFCLNSDVGHLNWLMYDTSVGNDFSVTCAYNDVERYTHSPYCNDLKIRFYYTFDRPEGIVGVMIRRYGTVYKATVDFSGEMVIAKVVDGVETILAQDSTNPEIMTKSGFLSFCCVDNQLIFCLNDDKVIFDLGRAPEREVFEAANVPPELRIFGSGKLKLSHIAIFRDIYYTEAGQSGRASGGNPFELEEDEFFMLGDNSANSEDGRWWDRPGIGNNGLAYREGIVPREYLVGQALFVYWPGGFRLFPKLLWAVVPNVGQMRFICGGSDQSR